MTASNFQVDVHVDRIIFSAHFEFNFLYFNKTYFMHIAYRWNNLLKHNILQSSFSQRFAQFQFTVNALLESITLHIALLKNFSRSPTLYNREFSHNTNFYSKGPFTFFWGFCLGSPGDHSEVRLSSLTQRCCFLKYVLINP